MSRHLDCSPGSFSGARVGAASVDPPGGGFEPGLFAVLLAVLLAVVLVVGLAAWLAPLLGPPCPERRTRPPSDGTPSGVATARWRVVRA